ncbi:MAG: hypothetical protein ABIN54_09705 [candidate division WOR-3 bacterium]
MKARALLHVHPRKVNNQRALLSWNMVGFRGIYFYRVVAEESVRTGTITVE